MCWQSETSWQRLAKVESKAYTLQQAAAAAATAANGGGIHSDSTKTAAETAVSNVRKNWRPCSGGSFPKDLSELFAGDLPIMVYIQLVKQRATRHLCWLQDLRSHHGTSAPMSLLAEPDLGRVCIRMDV